MRKPIITGILLILGLFILFGAATWKTHLFPNVPEFLAMQPPENTVRYVNATYDFEFWYPNKWQIASESQQKVEFKENEHQTKMEVRIIPIREALTYQKYPSLLAIEYIGDDVDVGREWFADLKKLYEEEQKKGNILYNWFESFPFIPNSKQENLGKEIHQGIYLLRGQGYPEKRISIFGRHPNSSSIVPSMRHHYDFEPSYWTAAFSTPGIQENVTMLIAIQDYIADINISGENVVTPDNEAGTIFKTFLPTQSEFYKQLTYENAAISRIVYKNRLAFGLQLSFVIIGLFLLLRFARKDRWKTLFIFSTLYMSLYVIAFTYYEAFNVDCSYQNPCSASLHDPAVFFIPGMSLFFVSLIATAYYFAQNNRIKCIFMAISTLVLPGILLTGMLFLWMLGGFA